MYFVESLRWKCEIALVIIYLRILFFAFLMTRIIIVIPQYINNWLFNHLRENTLRYCLTQVS